MRALAIAAVLLGVRVAYGAPVTVLVTVQTTELDAAGITHTARYQDRLYRDGDQVWLERVLPAGVVPRAARSDREIDLALAARWYRRAGDGVRASLVSAIDGVIVDVGPESFGSLGLADRWVVASALVDISMLSSAGDGWVARTTARETLRVRWNPKTELPLVIEATSRDGRSRSRTTLEVQPATAPPWSKADHFRHVDLSDLGD